MHDIDKLYREHATTVYKFLYTKTQNADWEIDYLKKIRAKRKMLLLAAVLVCTLIFGTVAAIGIKVEPAKGLANAYNVTVYGADRLGDTQEHNRKFEYTFKIPDDNNNWSVYSVGEIPQDTLLFWANTEYVDKKAELPLQKLTAYLTEHNGFSAETQHLERDWAEEILGDPCFIFDCHDAADCMGRNNSVPYAVSVDGARVYSFDTTKGMWVQL